MCEQCRYFEGQCRNSNTLNTNIFDSSFNCNSGIFNSKQKINDRISKLYELIDKEQRDLFLRGYIGTTELSRYYRKELEQLLLLQKYIN